MSTDISTHINLDESGVAWIDDTNVKVVEVVLDKLAHGSSPEEMHLQYPHLSLAQIYAALTYYHDHKEPFDRTIAEQLEKVDAATAHQLDSPLRDRLRRHESSS